MEPPDLMVQAYALSKTYCMQLFPWKVFLLKPLNLL